MEQVILNKQEIESSEKIWRLNLINSISGIKPANLIATKSKDGIENAAIFSSVVHLGSDPALIGFILRPYETEPRDTFRNIMQSGFYTINHIPKSLIKKSHYTSAKFNPEESEFDILKIEKEYLDGFYAPFVKKSPTKIGLKFIEKVPLSNGCSLVIGEIVLIVYQKLSINENGQLDLASTNTIGISGLNTYYSLEKIATLPFVRDKEIPNF